MVAFFILKTAADTKLAILVFASYRTQTPDIAPFALIMTRYRTFIIIFTFQLQQLPISTACITGFRLTQHHPFPTQRFNLFQKSKACCLSRTLTCGITVNRADGCDFSHFEAVSSR